MEQSVDCCCAQADAFISLHGSGEMNSMFMRRDSIKIQMRQKDFGTVHRYGGSPACMTGSIDPDEAEGLRDGAQVRGRSCQYDRIY